MKILSQRKTNMPTGIELLTILEQVFELGPYNMLLQCEKERGFEIVETGSVPWLPAADWPNDIVITQKGKEIRIVSIYAKRPGNGAFRRLITAIIQAGMVPVIVTPVHEMRDTMKRWGWKQKLTG